MTTNKTAPRSGEDSPFSRTLQHDAKRGAILSQAAKLFNYKGSRATTLQDIAESLGLTKTSLYYYVKTKEDLVYQCYRSALAHYHDALDQIERAHSTPVARARAFFLQHFENWLAAQEGRAPHTAALLEIAALKGSHREEIESQYIAMFTRLRGYIRDGIADGTIRTCEPTSATRAILGSLDWIFSWLHNFPMEQVESTAREAWDILAHGLAAEVRQTPPPGFNPADTPGNKLEGFNREEQNRLKQEAFYKTGTRFFNRQGFNGTSLDEIAEQLNVSKGAFYYHIKNKEDLLYSCYIRTLDIIENIHTEALNADVSGLEKAQAICLNTFLVQISSEGPLIRYNTIIALSPSRRRSILERTDRANAQFGNVLEQGIKDKSVRPVNTFVAQQLIAGAINAAMDLKQWRKIDTMNSAAIEYFDVYFNGLLPNAKA